MNVGGKVRTSAIGSTPNLPCFIVQILLLCSTYFNMVQPVLFFTIYHPRDDLGFIAS